MKTLEVKHIVPFAPYGLKGENKSTKEKYYLHGIDVVQKMVYVYDGGVIPGWLIINLFRPYLYPLSWLTKEIEHNGGKFVPMEKIDAWFLKVFKIIKKSGIQNTKAGTQGLFAQPYEVIEKLFEWHFDVFGLIPEGLAIDKSKLK